MSDGTEPRDYDREFTAHAGHRARRRLGIDVERGTVTRFALQLEYLVDPEGGEWAEVVRYDHDGTGESEFAHDVTEDGLHIDVYRDGEKIDSHELTPPLPAGEALDVAEEHLKEHLEGYVRRYERWHGIGSL
ncbi:MAG: hypothetical protein ABEJ31_09030 [Haloarculaceae archaeon]